jgi:hypothetical protein
MILCPTAKNAIPVNNLSANGLTAYSTPGKQVSQRRLWPGLH